MKDKNLTESLRDKEPTTSKSKYELRNVVCDYGIYENGELVLLLNDHMNAAYILDILKSDEQKRDILIWLL